MRLLFVVPYVPSRIRVRPYEFIRTLAQRHHVEVACLVSGAAEAAHLPALEAVCAAVHPISHPPMQAMLRAIWGGLAGQPLQAAFAISRALKQQVERIAAQFDVVHVEHLRGASTPLDLGTVPVIWDAVDCISLLLAEMDRAEQPLHVRAAQHIDAVRTRRYEAQLLQRFTQVIVTSARDAAALLELRSDADTTITIVPNGVDRDYFCPPPERHNTSDVVFTGKMSYHANHTAVRAFASEIWPTIHAAVPEARFLVVGSDPPHSIRNLNGTQGIIVTGSVPDIRPYLANATVAVAPLLYGVGNPNKVLEAMAMALPVVASPAALTSICARPHDGVIAAGRDTMAREIISLLQHPIRAATLGWHGRRYIATHHTWEHATERLEHVYSAANGLRAVGRLWATMAAD